MLNGCIEFAFFGIQDASSSSGAATVTFALPDLVEHRIHTNQLLRVRLLDSEAVRVAIGPGTFADRAWGYASKQVAMPLLLRWDGLL